MTKEWTGERLETFILNDTTIEHLHRYAIAAEICKGLDALDIASGEGYGSNLLSFSAGKVTGVDISKETVTAAAQKYRRDNLVYKEGSAAAIPLADNAVDVVVSFETIEHHDQHGKMLSEIKRVLKPGGILIMSSPDKKYYTDVPGYNNPFHVKELYFEEFKTLINSNFKFANFMSQKLVIGSLMLPEKPTGNFVEYTGDYQNIYTTGEFTPVYNMCIASDNEFNDGILGSLFDGKKINESIIALMMQNVRECAIKETEVRFKASWRYKIGHFLLFPVKLIGRNPK